MLADMSRRRTNIYLDAAQLDALRERALATRRSTADLVREAVNDYLAPAVGPVVRAAPAPLPAADWKPGVFAAANTLELLCTKAGQGTLASGGVALQLREAKPLPSSD